METIMKEDTDIFRSIGKFEAKIASLEKAVDRLEVCVDTITNAMAENRGSWRFLLSLAAISSLIGAVAHRPVEILLNLFK